VSTFAEKICGRLYRWWHDQQVSAIRRRLRSCGEGLSLDLPAVIRGEEHITIGNNVSINAFAHIWGQGGIAIGNDCLIASHVTLTTLTHDLKGARYRDTLVSLPIKIGNNVWIGTHAVILPGVTLGDGAVVGAGAVVTKDVPPRHVVAGTPAKVLRVLPPAGQS